MGGLKKSKTAVFSTILWISLIFQLCFASSARSQYHYYNEGITYDVTTSEYYAVWIDGQGTVVNLSASIPGGIFMCWYSPGATLNFGAGAYTDYIDAYDGSCVNLNGGSVGWMVFVSPDSQVTVAGERFVVGGITYNSGTKLYVGNAMVTAYDARGTQLFRGPIWCDTGATIMLGTEAADLEVKIDVKPGSDPAIINLSSSGLVPVAVLSDGTFDATGVLPGSVQFAGASVAVSQSGKYMAHVEDIDEDGDDDIVFQFQTKELKLEDGVAEAVLKLTGQLAGQATGPSVRSLQSTGQINDGKPISGTEKVYILRPKKK